MVVTGAAAPYIRSLRLMSLVGVYYELNGFFRRFVDATFVYIRIQ